MFNDLLYNKYLNNKLFIIKRVGCFEAFHLLNSNNIDFQIIYQGVYGVELYLPPEGEILLNNNGFNCKLVRG